MPALSPELAYLLGVFATFVALMLIVSWLAAGRLLRRVPPDPPRTPAAYGLPFEHVTFTARDGIELGGRLTGAPGRRSTVIFCAGMFGSMDGDTALVPAFHDAGLSVLQFDWRGHGISDGRRTSLGLREINDLLGAVDFLQARGVKRIGVMGFSMGGAVALRGAAEDRRIQCVACDGGYVRISHALAGGMKDRLGVRLMPLVWLVLRAVELRLGGARMRDANPLTVVAAISPRPVLLIYGDADPFVPLADQDALYAACAEPGDLWRVAGAGHREIDDEQPEAYRRRVTGFFIKHLR